MKEFLNTQGPIGVSDSAFEQFKSIFYETWNDGTPCSLNTDKLFYYWLNENNPDEIRRLCIRCLLRQPCYNQKPIVFINQKLLTDDPLRKILEILPKDGLYWQLHNRPKLLNEFYSEFYYSESRYIKDKADGSCDVSTVIEFLATVLDDEKALDLLQKHRAYKSNAKGSVSLPALSFRIISPTNRFPKAVREHYWKVISDGVKAEIEHGKFIEWDGKNFHGSDIKTPYLRGLYSSMDNLSNKDQHIPCTIASYLKILHNSIPKEFPFLERNLIIKTLPYLKDQDLAYDIARRHILLYPKGYVPVWTGQDSQVFLLWFIGLSVYHRCDGRATPTAVQLLGDLKADRLFG